MAHDLVVIGAGPGGYVAAIRAAQLGMKVAMVEREAVGGVCLNWGCIPSKALIRNAEVLSLIKRASEFGIGVEGVTADFAAGQARVRGVVDKLTRGVSGLLKKAGVEVITGDAAMVDAHTIGVGDDRLEAKNVIIATGARPRTLPDLDVDGELVITYREAATATGLPEHMVIVGGGPIGLEAAWVQAVYGVDVTVVEFLPSILPREDEDVSRCLTRYLERQGVTILTGSKVTGLSRNGKGGTVRVETPDGEQSLHADSILVAVGVRGNVEGLGLDNVGATVEHGFIQVDDTQRVTADGVYAIGDVTGRMPLAHVAQAQGVYVVEQIAGEEPTAIDYDAVPRAVYTNPQVASMGLTEREAKEKGHEVKTGRFPMSANGKALAAGEADGFAKVVVDASTGELLGAHLLGHGVTELLGELSLTRILEGTHLEVGAVINAHPTISEAVKEAALAVDGRAIHM